MSVYSHETAVRVEAPEITELELPMLKQGAENPSSAESVVLPSPMIPQNLFKTSAAVGLAILSSLQHSVRRSHKPSVIPISSAFSGMGGRSPEITMCVTSASPLEEKGNLSVNTWYTVIPKA